MNNMIHANEAIVGESYRLFPNGKRSRHIVAEFIGVSPKGNLVFVHTDPETEITVLLNNVEITETIQGVSEKSVDTQSLN